MRFKGITYQYFLSQYDLSLLRPFPEHRNHIGDKRIYLRHDIDSNIDASVRMAEYEQSIGIQSHYYALHLSDYWNKEGFEKLRYIQSLGHEMGFHNALITELILEEDLPAPLSLTEENIEQLKGKLHQYLGDMEREGLKVRGTCAHGHPTTKTHLYSNLDTWKHIDMKMKYDCNTVYRTHYHSDSANQWYGNPVDTAAMFSEKQQCVLMINIHPQWWE
jgi:hypothetical protein